MFIVVVLQKVMLLAPQMHLALQMHLDLPMHLDLQMLLDLPMRFLRKKKRLRNLKSQRRKFLHLRQPKPVEMMKKVIGFEYCYYYYLNFFRKKTNILYLFQLDQPTTDDNPFASDSPFGASDAFGTSDAFGASAFGDTSAKVKFCISIFSYSISD